MHQKLKALLNAACKVVDTLLLGDQWPRWWRTHCLTIVTGVMSLKVLDQLEMTLVWKCAEIEFPSASCLNNLERLKIFRDIVLDMILLYLITYLRATYRNTGQLFRPLLSSVSICRVQVFAGLSGHGDPIRNIIPLLKKEDVHTLIKYLKMIFLSNNQKKKKRLKSTGKIWEAAAFF